MKSLILLFIIGIAFAPFAQEFEKKKVKVKYFKPALHHEEVTSDVNVYITEPIEPKSEEKITTLASLNTDARARFYYQKMNIFSKQIKPTDVIQSKEEKDTIALFEIELKDVIIGETNFYQEDIKKPDGTITGKKWIVSMTRSLPMVYSYSDENGVKIFDHEELIALKTLKYPDSFMGKAPKYYKKSDLEKVFNEKRIGIENLAKDKCFIECTRMLKGIIKDAFTSIYSNFVVNVMALKLKGKQKPAYTDALELEQRMLAVLDKVCENGKAENNKNWHTDEIFAEFSALKEAYIKMLGEDVEKENAGETPRFENSTFLALSKNMLWCLFFVNEHAEVLKQAEQLEKSDYENTSVESFGSMMNDFKITWIRLRYISETYAPVYLKNKEKYNWN